MNTEFIKIKSENDKEQINKAAEILKNGGLVAIPTETVYGLAANALNGKAVAKIFKAKGRPMDNPLIVHIGAFNEIHPLVSEIPEKAKKLAKAFWPGPLTMILPKSKLIPDEVSAGLNSVGIRMPSNKIANAVIEAAGVPLAAPSANTSGKPSPTLARHVMDDMNGKIDAVADGGESEVGVESTVITLITDPPRILRPGGITPEQIKSVIGDIDIDDAVLNKLKDGVVAASPGMKYKHYSPKAEVYIIESDINGFRYYTDAHKDEKYKDMALVFSGEEDKVTLEAMSFGDETKPEEQAHSLFTLLRTFDEKQADRVFVRSPSKEGVGLAVYNRLLRSAGFRVIKPPVIYALTGQTGAGKTTVADELKKKNYLVIDGDAVSRSVTEKNSPVLKQLCKTFGNDILKPTGELDRKLLAKRSFSSQKNRKELNAIMHPAITEYVLKQIKENENKYNKVFIDAAVIFESKLIDYCSEIVVVTADKNIRLKRIMERDRISRQTALERINAQKDEQFYKSIANITIDNNGDMVYIVNQLKQL